MFWRTRSSGRHAVPAKPRPWRRSAFLDWRRVRRRLRAVPDDGMSTAEYAIGTLAAAAFAAVLYAIVTGDSVVSGLTSLIERALTASF
ncbi:MAG TPA: DUF4244 domain-containing protein [Amycolatopsis sp.]|uniref:DUF4244 domain-containing protein n=1 Tax=Amycolatopsis sp. TaxID=37632 RepID=UPI002B47797B|nr:DUF4244 domain-containing protein [Amycolatopsis sp.]HKS45335.1 DUF4244 domain-containing protein [Amycolatopsis sp.]